MQVLPEKPVLLTVYGYFKTPVSHVQTRFKCSRFGVFTFKNANFKGSRFKKGVPIHGSQVQNHWVDPKSTQPFIFPKSIKWVQAEACNFIKKETLTRVFSCEFCEISKSTFFYRNFPVAASAQMASWSVSPNSRLGLLFSPLKIIKKEMKVVEKGGMFQKKIMTH